MVQHTRQGTTGTRLDELRQEGLGQGKQVAVECRGGFRAGVGDVPSAMRVTARDSSPSVSLRANRTSTSDQSGNISLMMATLLPYCFLSWPISPSSSRDGSDDDSVESPLVLVALRPPRVERPPRPPRPEPLPRAAAGLLCTSDIAEMCMWKVCGRQDEWVAEWWACRVSRGQPVQ